MLCLMLMTGNALTGKNSNISPGDELIMSLFFADVG